MLCGGVVTKKKQYLGSVENYVDVIPDSKVINSLNTDSNWRMENFRAPYL